MKIETAINIVISVGWKDADKINPSPETGYTKRSNDESFV